MEAPAHIKRILLPVDIAEMSRPAYDHAADLARRFHASIDVLYIWDPSSQITPAARMRLLPGDERPVEEMAHHVADAEVSAVRRNLEQEGVESVTARIEVGEPAEQILRVAGEGGYDLVVMGTHGRTRLSQLLLGSVASAVVRRSPCPVMTVGELTSHAGTNL